MDSDTQYHSKSSKYKKTSVVDGNKVTYKETSYSDSDGVHKTTKLKDLGDGRSLVEVYDNTEHEQEKHKKSRR